MGVFGIVAVVVAVVIGVAVAYDLRARHRRALAADFREAARINSRRAAQDEQSTGAHRRPTNLGDGPTSGIGPSMGP